MKSVLAPVAAMLVVCAGFAHGSIISISGTGPGSTGINGLAEGWSMNFSDTVLVAAYLNNGNGALPATGNTAYLTSGSSPNLGDVLDSTNFTLPGNYVGMFTLFSGVTLNPGNYWLIFASPGPPASYANWVVSDPANISTAAGAQFLGYSDSLDGNNTFITPIQNGYAYQLEVSDVPEPSSPVLCLPALVSAGCFRLLFARRGRRTRS
jgi:hypothetical protein